MNEAGRAAAAWPRRIVCLTEETVETLYLLGEQERIVGVSGYAKRPPEVRSKPRAAAFQSAKFEKILELEPDLVLTFCDVQAEIAKELIRLGVTVFAFNQRSVAEIFAMMATLARIVSREREGLELIEKMERGLEEIRQSAKSFAHRPRVYFEEWNDPLITGIEWVEELIGISGGETIFPELRRCGKAQDRVVSAEAVIERDPEVILASWCGKKVDVASIAARPGWSGISAVRNGHVYEIDSTIILQPGPAALTDGMRAMHEALARAVGASSVELS